MLAKPLFLLRLLLLRLQILILLLLQNRLILRQSGNTQQRVAVFAGWERASKGDSVELAGGALGWIDVVGDEAAATLALPQTFRWRLISHRIEVGGGMSVFDWDVGRLRVLSRNVATCFGVPVLVKVLLRLPHLAYTDQVLVLLVRFVRFGNQLLPWHLATFLISLQRLHSRRPQRNLLRIQVTVLLPCIQLLLLLINRLQQIQSAQRGHLILCWPCLLLWAGPDLLTLRRNWPLLLSWIRDGGSRPRWWLWLFGLRGRSGGLPT